MTQLSRDRSIFEFGININPAKADIIVFPVEDSGDVPDSFISKYAHEGLSQFAFSKASKPNEGFELLRSSDLKPALALVVDSPINFKKQDTIANLKKGMEALGKNAKNQILWIPVNSIVGLNSLMVSEFLEEIVGDFKGFHSLLELKKVIFSLNDSKENRKIVSTYLTANLSDVLERAIFYLVGSYWDGVEKSTEFFEKGIWQNGYAERFIEVVNGVKKGDFLILKSSFQQEGKGVLRIKAIGRVLSNPQNGRDLEVEWFYLKRFRDFPDYGYYRKTIQESNPDDVDLFLNELLTEQEDLRTWLGNIKEPDTAEMIAGLHPDSPKGEDLLDFEPDLKAISQVMTFKQVAPPLAIGLFGSWGSGKSFFMEQLYNRVEEIAKYSDKDAPFCSGVAQIRFNAWSYMDTNLWAGLITKIFDGLFQYISENTEGDEKRRQAAKMINEKLTITKAEMASIESKKSELSSKLKDVLAKKGKLSSELVIKKEALKTKSAENVLAGLESFISDKLDENDLNHLNQVRGIAINASKVSPREVYKQLRSSRVFIIELLTSKEIGWGFGIAFTVFIFFSALTIVWAEYNLISLTASFLTCAIAISQRVSDSLVKLRPLWSQFSSLKNDFEKEKTKLESEAASEIDAINSQICFLQEDLMRNQEAAIELKASISTLEYRANNLLATEALYSFIEERSKGRTYKKFYGIISLIRDDFEILSNLLVNHQNEKLTADESEKELEFQMLFKKPLERIVLYIDDLDRCNEEQVVKVLEAVNLLLAFPLFVVVVGVDPRWVKNALLKEHHGQFGFYDKNLAHEDFEPMDPANYLEKIFQVPFHLKKTSNEAIKGILAKLTPILEIKQQSEDRKASMVKESAVSKKAVQKESEVLNQIMLKKKRTKSLPESMALEPLELEIMQELSEIIGPNPRAIKRFVNVYLIIRAHDYRLKMTQSKEEEYLIMQFLLALCIGPYKCLVDSLEDNIGIAPGVSLEGFFNYDFGKKTHLKRPMNLYLADLAEILDHSKRLKVLLRKVEMSDVYQHYKFIRRFTFRDLRPELDFE